MNTNSSTPAAQESIFRGALFFITFFITDIAANALPFLVSIHVRLFSFNASLFWAWARKNKKFSLAGVRFLLTSRILILFFRIALFLNTLPNLRLLSCDYGNKLTVAAIRCSKGRDTWASSVVCLDKYS